jgi:hypothetical protein
MFYEQILCYYNGMEDEEEENEGGRGGEKGVNLR